MSAHALASIVAVSLVVSQSAIGVYDVLGRPVPEGVSALGNLLVSLSVIAWFRGYSRRHVVTWVFDMGTFLLVLWVLIVPYYVVKREGWRGVGRVAVFVLAYLAAALVGGLVGRTVVELMTA